MPNRMLVCLLVLVLTGCEQSNYVKPYSVSEPIIGENHSHITLQAEIVHQQFEAAYHHDDLNFHDEHFHYKKRLGDIFSVPVGHNGRLQIDNIKAGILDRRVIELASHDLAVPEIQGHHPHGLGIKYKQSL